MNSRKITSLRENKTAGANGLLDAPRYVLTYKPGEPGKESLRTSYEILTALKSDSDVVMEVNSSLFYRSDKTDELIYGFIDIIKELSLDYRYRRVAPSVSPGIFNMILGKSRQDAHEIQVLIPGESWDSNKISDLLLPYGVRYYFTGKEAANSSLLDEMQRMTGPDKLKFFKLIIFDVNTTGQMGINTTMLSLSDLQSLTITFF